MGAESLYAYLVLCCVPGWGAKGDVIDAPRSFARNELILLGRAMYATPENLEWAEQFRHSGVKIQRFSSKTSPATIRYLKTRVYALSKFEERVRIRSRGSSVEFQTTDLNHWNSESGTTTMSVSFFQS